MSDVTPEAAAYPRRWLALYTILMTNFMSLMDVTIVNVALPTIQNDLGMTDSGLEWLVAGFVLALALGLLPMGRTGDIFGKKRLFLIGVACFTGASCLCGLAPTGEFLIAARVLQGISAAIMTPQTLALTQQMFTGEERGSAFALFGLTASLAAVSGPAIGGVLIALDIGGTDWRPIFLINLPIGLLALWLGARLIPPSPGQGKLRQDWIGILLITIATLCLIFPMIEGRSLNWPGWIFAMLLAAPIVAFVFVSWERRQARHGKPELLPTALIGQREYATGAVMIMGLFSTTPAFFFVFALFLQKGLGLTPLQSGLTTIPFSIGIMVSSLVAARLGARWPFRRIFAGLFLYGCGLLALWLTIRLGSGPVENQFIAPLIVAGLGVGTTISPLFQTTLANVAQESTGSASGALQAFQQCGGAIGVSVIGLFFFGSLTTATSGSHTKIYRVAMSLGMIYPMLTVILVALLARTISRQSA